MLEKAWAAFTHKDGQWSKTAFFLSVATFVALFLWPVQSLFAGLVVKGHTIPAFDWSAAAAMLTTVYAVYIGNHKIKGIKTEIKQGSIKLDKENE